MFWSVLTVPELTAKQSSWFLIIALLMVTPLLSPTTEASELWPPLSSPSEFLQIRDSKPLTGCPTNRHTVFASNRHIQLVVPYRKWYIVSRASPRYTNLKSSFGAACYDLGLSGAVEWVNACNELAQSVTLDYEKVGVPAPVTFVF